MSYRKNCMLITKLERTGKNVVIYFITVRKHFVVQVDELISHFIMEIRLLLAVFLGVCAVVAADDMAAQDQTVEEKVEVDQEQIDYAKGSLCGYCEYCKFCQLCDADCPCEKSATKPNCHMCKYCKYCTFCDNLCGTICQPGGIIDRASAAVFNALPDFNKDEVDEEIDGVRHWINKKKEEL